MSISIEENLQKLFNGQSLGDITPELCDWTLKDQNLAVESKGIKPTVSDDFVPVLGKTITYIVVVILINEDNEVLMMQEAKDSCYGKWYLPAGRMEKNESIREAAIREVYEETGLNVEVKTLLSVETSTGCWFRFVLTGNVIGGTLKTLDDADKESLQSKWIKNLDDVELRSNDILQIVEHGLNYYKNKRAKMQWHKELLPAQHSHFKNYLRVIAIIRRKSSNSLNILLSEKNILHFPTVEIHPARSLHSTLRQFMIELFGADLPQHRPHGIVSVEHQISQIPTDGVCLSLLVVFRPPLEEVSLIGKCVWHEISKDYAQEIEDSLSHKNSTFPLHVIR